MNSCMNWSYFQSIRNDTHTNVNLTFRDERFDVDVQDKERYTWCH